MNDDQIKIYFGSESGKEVSKKMMVFLTENGYQPISDDKSPFVLYTKRIKKKIKVSKKKSKNN